MNACIYDEDDVSGVKFDVVEIPDEFIEQANEYREALIEAISDFDDDIASKYLEGLDISEDELKLGIRKATLSLKFVGVIPGSAFKNKGVQMLMDAVVDYLPSPLDLPPTKGEDSDGNETEVVPDDSRKVAGLAFKLMSDPYVGKLVFYRVYQGSLQKGSTLYNPRTRKSERISRLMIMKSNDREDIETAYSGDICALIGVKNVVTGDTLADRDLDIRLEPPTFPDPVISMSIEPATKADQEKMSIGLQRLAEEDPTFDVGGIDAAHKLTILASLLFNVPLAFDKISIAGISDVELEDINYAKKMGYRIKHLAVAEKYDSGIELRVHPTLVSESDMLSKVNEEMNAIRLEGDMLGPLLISGAGAGAGPTASSVIADIVDSTKGFKLHWNPLASDHDGFASDFFVTESREIPSAFYYRLVAKNEPGMLASITNVLADNKISIEAVIQDEESKKSDKVPIVILTEKIRQQKADAACLALSKMPGIFSPVKQFRVQKGSLNGK